MRYAAWAACFICFANEIYNKHLSRPAGHITFRRNISRRRYIANSGRNLYRFETVVRLARQYFMRLAARDIFASQMRYAAYAVRYICFANAICGLRRAIYLLRKCDIRLAPRDIFASQVRYAACAARYICFANVICNKHLSRPAGHIAFRRNISRRRYIANSGRNLYRFETVKRLARQYSMRLAARDIFALQMRYAAWAA